MRKPQQNMRRGTPGLMLLGFAMLLLVAAVVHVVQFRQHPVQDEIHGLTGLGDGAHYASLSGNDFYNPALVFDAAPKGLYRRSVNAVVRPDARMLRHGVESTGHYIVYTESIHGKPVSPARWFLKEGDNRYIEFGERNHWPAFEATKAGAAAH